MNPFEIESEYQPAGDQPAAIERLVNGVAAGMRFQTLMGVTGSGKTFTLANALAHLNRPVLVISHNKTLTAQLFSEFTHFFPKNEVHYFVSFYDYYQPESYIPQTDTYIEKDSEINDRIDRLRLAATAAVLTRRDTIVVASVSCIYGLGAPSDFLEMVQVLQAGHSYPQKTLLQRLVRMQYQNGQIEFKRGTFRVRGDTIEVYLAHASAAYRLEFFGDTLDRIVETEPITGRARKTMDFAVIYPAKHYVTTDEKRKSAIAAIEEELRHRLPELKAAGQEHYAERLKSRTLYDLEMLTEIGYCKGIENYSRHLSGRAPGEPPFTLLDYFAHRGNAAAEAKPAPRGKPDFLTIIDESHVTIPQLHAMLNGDRARKKNLVDFGFRLPCAYDNRPLSFEEFMGSVGQVIFSSATPGEYELSVSGQVVEQIVRPTGLVDPEIVVRPVEGQVDDLIREIRAAVSAGERVLVTTLTKKMSEDLTEFLCQEKLRVKYLHSDIETLDRIKILRDLRLGRFDVLVGINLLREGLDLPEVALVAILDAHQEGFLRSKVSLIQTIGRAARHIRGRVILYAERTTQSMEDAILETGRRRAKQVEYNRAHGIEPRSIQSAVKEELVEQDQVIEIAEQVRDKRELVRRLEREMFAAADALEFEKAAALRDVIADLEQKRK
ncbi:MAG: excinuclease ABC subunit B [Candidatus Lindowbacteria bacterium RIFCSPLOWO2_12_FULL_62_27]|nr:MAG: excinuclease ABC subunit B [Candidatus Lindowbacteria bacterium RIFCSPLOWO2_02_FULL_62_12]OGH59030.1 MAG: excinuclease ABC subunit B [Candidatus Lindowbacteria bacterium RIFCSPLOWO2_12_FULL_62_27]